MADKDKWNKRFYE